MNWENTFQRLKRIIEVKDGLYCEHLPLVGNEDNIVINSGNKKVCKKCCDHHEFEPFVNKESEKVCLSCCHHNYGERDGMGGWFCTECFSEISQNFCAPISGTIIRWQKRKERQEKQIEEKIKNKQNFQSKKKLIAIAKSLNL